MTFLAAIGVAMSKALFAYDAWNTVTFAAEEIREPQRNLPRALILGSVVTTLVYTGACAVYLYILPLTRMAHVVENRVAADVAGRAPRRLRRDRGVDRDPGVHVRLRQRAHPRRRTRALRHGARRPLLRPAARVHPRHHTPQNALVLQGVWSSVLALSGSYSALLTYVTFASLAFNALTVAGLFVLRQKRPDADRPYRTWGYPVTPALYLLGAGFFVLYIFIGDKRDALIGLGLVLLGLPAYLLFRRRR